MTVLLDYIWGEGKDYIVVCVCGGVDLVYFNIYDPYIAQLGFFNIYFWLCWVFVTVLTFL